MPERPAKPSLAVIVPATDAPPTLERCLDAVRQAGAGAEVIVQTRPSGAGPAEARNAGAARAVAEVLVFVDADVIVHPDALTRIQELFAADPELAAAFGAYDDRPAAAEAVSRFRNLLHHHTHMTSPGPAETFWAGLGAIRRETFFASGGFDPERFPRPAIEDIDLGRRVRAGGGRILLDPEIQGTHLKRWSLVDMVRTDLLRRGVPWARIQFEERELSSSLNLSWRYRFSAVSALAVALGIASRRPAVAAAGLAANVAVNRDFYALLERRGGARLVLAGVPLRILHELVGGASLVVAAAEHAADGFPRAVEAQ